MRDKDLKVMRFEELWELHERIARLLADRISAEKRQLESRLRQLNRGDLIGDEKLAESAVAGRAPRRKYPRVLPKYFNPQSPSETWSGRGKTPRWMAVALRSGHKMEDFRIANGDRRIK